MTDFKTVNKAERVRRYAEQMNHEFRVITHSRLFLQRRYQELDMPMGDCTQEQKQARRVEQYLGQQEEKDNAEHQAGGWDEDEEPPEVKRYDAYCAFYAQLSKITRQVWRFLKNCFREKSSLTLYQRQLKPLLQGYL